MNMFMGMCMSAHARAHVCRHVGVQVCGCGCTFMGLWVCAHACACSQVCVGVHLHIWACGNQH